jgi:hypothetical protein
MINMNSLNFGSVYSFEPGFFREIENETPHIIEETATYHLDKTDTMLSGVLATLIFFLLIGMIASFIT